MTDDALLPPADPRRVTRTGFLGLGCVTVAALLGGVALALGDSTPSLVQTLRLALVGLGAITVGAAVSQRPGDWSPWLIGAATFLLAAWLGLPGHWDSGRLLARVLAGVFVVGGVLVLLPLVWRLSILSLAAMFHFSGILVAVTWPDPTPWLTNQLGNRVYMPYLSFMYLRNAYHFYSPEPGPASLLACLLRYETDETDPATGKPKVLHEWIVLPKRDEHMRDPLGQTYNRRLSITEMVATAIPGLATGLNFEKSDVVQRRQRAGIVASGQSKEPIPLVTLEESAELQYRVPQAHITRYLLPSYARHLASAYSAPGRRVTQIKIYRFEHRIMPTAQFVLGGDPFHPATYKPYFYGDYDATGKLLNPQDEMLYWLVPIVPRRGGPSPADPEKKDYIDYLSKHAGFEFDWGGLRP